MLSIINMMIAERTNYGVRSCVALASGYKVIWSNASASWYIGRRYKARDTLTLDANEIFVAGKKSVIESEIKMYDPLPLYRNSFEARSLVSRCLTV